MFTMRKTTIGIVLFLAVVLVVGASYGYLAWYKDYAPRMQDARHKVFKQTQSYIDGKITHLSRLRLDYETQGKSHGSVLRATILREASTVDQSKLPSELRQFIEGLRKGKTE